MLTEKGCTINGNPSIFRTCPKWSEEAVFIAFWIFGDNFIFFYLPKASILISLRLCLTPITGAKVPEPLACDYMPLPQE